MALSARRILNLFKLYLSYHIARRTKSGKVTGSPFSISIEPTTSCNLRCPECPSGLRSFNRKTGNIQLKTAQRIVDQLYKTTAYINFYFQGEPLISPHFYDMVSYARGKRIFTSTSTNGHFLNHKNCERIIESGLNRLIISIDGTTQAVYENYRKEGDLNKVIEGTKNIIAARRKHKKGPEIIFQFLVVAPNEHQVNDVLRLGKELGVDEVRLKTAQVYDFKNGNPLIPKNEKYARYVQKKDGTYRLKGRYGNHCWRMWQGCVFTWDGKVVPCCFDKDAHHQMGDILATEFHAIWYSPPYTQFRKAILTGRNDIEICKNCSEGAKVWA